MRSQMIAQGEAISGQQSRLSEQASIIQEQRMNNEQLLQQVMESQQGEQTEQQRALFLERQQRVRYINMMSEFYQV